MPVRRLSRLQPLRLSYRSSEASLLYPLSDPGRRWRLPCQCQESALSPLQFFHYPLGALPLPNPSSSTPLHFLPRTPSPYPRGQEWRMVACRPRGRLPSFLDSVALPLFRNTPRLGLKTCS